MNNININELNQRLLTIEEKFSELGYNQQRLVETNMKRSFKISSQKQTLNAPIVGYCISTIDPLNLNRVRIYHPLLCEPDVKIGDLPFARNCTNTGGHDDCGGTWVPPAGSTVVIVCENGDRQMPIVIGTVWHKNRGPNASYFPYPVDEFYRLWGREGYRGQGYLVGKTDGSQAYPPWSGESQNNQDFDNEQDIDKDPDAQQKITYPNIYGWKTPGRHYIKMVDGDHRCNNRWARFEIMSKTGHWIMLKDDWYHPSGEWANPAGGCNASGTVDQSGCDSVSALVSENVFGIQDAAGNFAGGTNSGGVGGRANECKASPRPVTKCSNPYHKRFEECRPYRGRNKCSLPQSGVQVQCISGHQMVMDDAVNQPKEGKINSNRQFDFGCDNKYKGKFYCKSATGHMFMFDDTEDVEQIRGINNGIRMQSACGNYLYFIDHTLEGCIAGKRRGVIMGSTSGHTLEMNDNLNEQCSPTRSGLIGLDDLGRDAKLTPAPTPKAKNAFVNLRSGYGLFLRMDDSTDQENTRNQFIMLCAAPKDKPIGCDNQPHTLIMQLEEKGGGFVQISSGGLFLIASRGDSVEAVGTEACEANKLIGVMKGSYLLYASKYILSKCITQLNIADKYIILGAGKDCPIPEDPEEAEETAGESLEFTDDAVDSATAGDTKPVEDKGPCIYPVIVAKAPIRCPYTGIIHFTTYSDRVFASTS